MSIDPTDLLTILNERQLGKPYKWAQQLCGLEFVPTTSITSTHFTGISHDLAQSSVPQIIKQIRSRWQARLGLNDQIIALENYNATLDKQAAVKISSSLVTFTPITWDEYLSDGTTHRFIDENVVTAHDLYYRAIITRGTAKLICLICVSANYPNEMPLWTIQLNWHGDHWAQNNSTIRVNNLNNFFFLID